VSAHCVGAAISVDFIGYFVTGDLPPHLPFQVGYYDRFEKLEARKDYLVAVEMVNLHVSLGDALASGLFGPLGEELVVLINATDEEAIRMYYEL
jgi:hypothetical protein